MSRHNKEISAFCSENLNLASLSNLTISDPSRLKIPFGSKGKFSGRQASWPVIQDPEQPPHNTHIEAVIDIPAVQEEPPHTRVRGWWLPLGYIIFGMSLALCNLLTVPHCQLVCSFLSPLPLICLLGQAMSVQTPWHSLPVTLCAFLIPLECSLWNLYCILPFSLCLACAVTLASPRRGVVTWILLAGVILSLCLALPIPTLNISPRWGVTISLFFLCLLCAVTSLQAIKVTFTVDSA